MAEQEQGQRKQGNLQTQEKLRKEILAPSSENLMEATQSLVAALAETVRAEVIKTKDESTIDIGKNIVTLEEGFSARDTFTTKASEITRQLGLAGIAVIWVFKTSQGVDYSVPGELLPPGLMLIVGLTLDFLHYVVGATLWQWYTKAAQLAGKEEFEAPSWINTLTWSLFIAKIIAIITAYVYLISYLVGKIFK